MSTRLLALAAQLSDEALLAHVKLLTERSRDVTVELVAHLGELDVRRLHCSEGAGSLFRYCTEILRLSESAACNRIKAARAARRFPVILDLLADGSVNLTTVRLLSPHLTAENYAALLREATRMTRRQVDKLVARLAPQPDVPSLIRKQPQPTPTPSAAVGEAQTLRVDDTTVAGPSRLVPSPMAAPKPVTPSPQAASRPMVVAPLSPGRYRVQFTVDEETQEQLRRLQDLLRREIPDGDLGKIVARAVPLLLRDVERRTFGATSQPRPTRPTTPGSRHIPAEVERQVWARDGGQCAFLAASGHRCTERTYLEFHHAGRPYALGGEATVENIALRCRAHNVYEAKLVFGPTSRREWEIPAAP